MNDAFTYNDERFADLQMLRYEVRGFENLSLRQKLLVYHLSEAALWGRDILWDQNGRYNLRIRRLLEAVYENYTERNTDQFRVFTIYLKRVWFSNGIHHHYGCQKLLPEFSQEFLREAVMQLDERLLPLQEGETREQMIDELWPVIFDPSVESKRVNLSRDEDIVLTSACNYYGEDVTQAEAEAFYARQKASGDALRPIMYGLNSRLVKENGQLKEEVWRSGGLYGKAIDHIICELTSALPYAENERQQQVIQTLIDFYRTGDLQTFDQYSIQWLQETDGEIDFTNGFIEVYGDPLGLKASWEGYVNLLDKEATRRAQTLSDNAQWFEDHSPVDPCYRKRECRGVSAKVIQAAMLGGDLYPASAIGINLPNSDWLRAEYGSKSVTISNLTKAYDEAAKGSGFREEFVIDTETLQLVSRYGTLCDDLHTDLHECLGHGSGQMKPNVTADSLKNYASVIEEARADLFALYYLADAKLVELGLLPDAEAYKANYYTYLLNGLLTQMVRIQPGHQIEEAHMRNRALIARWVMEHYASALCLERHAGKTFLRIKDYSLLRTAFACLLREVQRIKSEGDYAAASHLVETYGVRLDATLHSEILARYERLNLAPYKGFINPQYELVRGTEGEIADVRIRYGEPYDQQMLRYGRQYCGIV